MPFPLAHPAAVLPLRRLCPRFLSFPALVIGSLSPDLGYLASSARLGEFSHRFLAGSLEFSVPIGISIFLAFSIVRSRLIQSLPARHQLALLPLCHRTVGSPISIVASLLLGAWTHLLLDAFTHPDEWLVEYLPILRREALVVGMDHFMFCEVLYAVFTFSGVAWLANSYLNWLEANQVPPTPIAPRVNRVCALLLASTILVVAGYFRSINSLLGTLSAGLISLLLVIAFLWGTEQLANHRRRR